MKLTQLNICIESLQTHKISLKKILGWNSYTQKEFKTSQTRSLICKSSVCGKGFRDWKQTKNILEMQLMMCLGMGFHRF